MRNPAKWEAPCETLASAILFHIAQNGAQLSFGEFFSLMASSQDFTKWYSTVLADCGLQAFFWEFPPLTRESLDTKVEFVLVEAASLAALQPESASFDGQFSRQPGADVVVFPNLGGDALLIVPAPLGPSLAYPHLAAFLRHAPESQVTALWKITADRLLANLSRDPHWLSTAGLGVPWLHLRIDIRPKYYRFEPYKIAA